MECRARIDIIRKLFFYTHADRSKSMINPVEEILQSRTNLQSCKDIVLVKENAITSYMPQHIITHLLYLVSTTSASKNQQAWMQ